MFEDQAQEGGHLDLFASVAEGVDMGMIISPEFLVTVT